MSAALLKLVAPVLLALIAAGVLAWLCDRNGYARARAHYEPILLQVGTQAALAEDRARAAEAAYAAVNVDINTEDEQLAQDAIRQRDAAITELAAIRVRLAKALARRCEMPGVSGGTGEPAATPGVPGERAERADAALAGLALSCQRDRDRLTLWQRWHQQQAAIAAAQPSP